MSNVSTEVLRDRGPMDVRGITAEVAKRLGHRVDYDTTVAALHMDAERGLVERVERTKDYRTEIWKSVSYAERR